jgi:Osmosensitive K+ channel histidine kinase
VNLTTGRLKVVHPSQPATHEPGVTGSASVAEPEDDDVVSLRSQALRTPLDSMVVFADLVASDDVTEEQRQLYAGRLRRESRRLSGLIDNALALQRLEAGRRDLDLGPVDVGSLMRRAVAAAGEDERLPISVQAPDRLPLVWADAEAILEVLANFLDNARRFSLGGGAITVEARAAGEMVEVSVRDHGIGLEADELPKVFRKFYRAENGLRMRGPGAGLGLAINRRIIESHGGQVAATSAGPGKGARFQFTLPLARGLTTSDYVLIVDGDAAFARLLKTELAAIGLETLRASDSETAAQLLAGTSPRAVILDLRFAGLPGTDFLARVRSDRNTQVPIVMLAAEDVLAAELSALEEWDVEVLPKEAGAPQAAAALIAEALTP